MLRWLTDQRLFRAALSLGIFALFLTPCASLAGVNIPDWVRQAAAQQQATYPPETNAVVLLDATDFTVLSSGDYIEHSRHVVRVLRPDGRTQRDLEVDLESNDKLQSIHAWTIDAAGREFEIKQKDFVQDNQYPTWMLYADDHSVIAKAPAPLPGSVIALEYEVRRHEWINELGWIFQDTIPVAQCVLTVTLPPGWEYRTAWTHRGAIDPVQLGPNTWQWNLKNVPGIGEEREPMMPSLLSLAGRMSLSYFAPDAKAGTAASWRQVGEWYAGLTEGRYSATPEISAKVQELTAGKADFAAKVQAL